MRQTYRVEALALHQVGVFDDIRLDFKPIASAERDAGKAEIHVFTGPNGCGKSTLLYAIAEMFEVFHRDGLIHRRFHGVDSSADFLFAGKAGHYGVRKPAGKKTDGSFDGVFGPYWDISYLWNLSKDFSLSDIQDNIFGVFFGFDQQSKIFEHKKQLECFIQVPPFSQYRFSFAVFAYSGQRTLNDIKLGAIQQIESSPFENALSFDKTARPQILLQWIANNRAQAALARQDGDQAAAQTYDLALARITNLIRDVCDLDVEFRLQRSPLAVTLRVNGVAIHFDGLPDGLKSIISWVADLSLRLEAIPWEQESGDVFQQPVILLLDEVDIHLHPKWQRRILPAIQKLLPNSQIFVSTHSPFVVGSVEDAWVYRLPEPGKSTGSQLVEGIPSAAGKSYRLILEEVFGIDAEFDVETEELFAAFYEARQQFLKSLEQPDSVLTLARQLAGRGEESAQIVARELRQLSRVTGREIGLA